MREPTAVESSCHPDRMTRTAAALVLSTLALTACGSDAEPDVKVTVTATPTVSATPTPEYTPPPPPTPIEQLTPAELAEEYRGDSVLPDRRAVASIGVKEGGITEVLTHLSPNDPSDSGYHICNAVHTFLVDRSGNSGERVQLRVRDKDLRVVADDLSGRCKAT